MNSSGDPKGPASGKAGTREPFRLALRHPEQSAKVPPCQTHCPGHGDVRRWIGVVAQRERLGLSLDEACRKAWEILVERNPFPATMGRVCPHPCQAGCNRSEKDGAVAINALERFLGDWALDQRLPLPRERTGGQPESIGVIGGGPAGLSFAWQMARRGYQVTVYERHDELGGMLRYGIPEYRLPRRVLAAEVRRILDLGVCAFTGTAIGADVSVEQLHERHRIVFLGIGAQRSRLLGVPGEAGAGVWSGTEYLERINVGRPVSLGGRVAVIGGGNTAVDAARAARRQGAAVTILYRRTRAEMPAIAEEVDDAIAEGVHIEYLTAPLEVLRRCGIVTGVRVQRMCLGECDADGRRRAAPVSGTVAELPADGIIVAISQEPDWTGLRDPGAADRRPYGKEGLLAGGDVLGLGVASLAIGQGRVAAETAHAQLRGVVSEPAADPSPIALDLAHRDRYDAAETATPPRRPVAERLAQADAEIVGRIDQQAFLAEVARCFSCGLCFGCQNCQMYCNAECYTEVLEPQPGAYFALALDRCEGCGKCIEVCPSGFLGLATF